MDDRNAYLISGTAILFFWLGYKSAKLINEVPTEWGMMDALTVIPATGVILYGIFDGKWPGKLSRRTRRR